MAQPTGYTPQHAFVADSATVPNFPGQSLDVEFQSVKTTTDQIRTNLALVQRDDGGLANGTVTFDTLSGTLQTAGIAPANAWATATLYMVGISVMANGNLYRCLIQHTAGVFATDLAAAKWLFVTAFPIPTPTATTIGGVKSLAPVASKWINSLGTDGTLTQTQPAFTDISGSVTASQMPSVTNALLATAPARSVKGNANSFTGGVSDLTNPAVLGISLVPAANSVSWSGNSEVNSAFVTSQSGAGQTYVSNPALGVQQYFNLFNITSDTISCGSNVNASYAVGLAGNYAFGGAGTTGGREGLFIALTQIAATDASNTIRFYAAVSGQAQANSSDGGTIGGGNEKGRHYGSNFIGALSNGATGFEQVSASYDQVFMLAGSSAKTKIINHAVYGIGDAVQGSTFDAGYGLSAETGALTGGNFGFLIGNMAGLHPLVATGTILATTGTSTVANGLDFSSYTITGNFLKATGFTVSGSGSVASAGSVLSSSATAGVGYATGAGGTVTQATSRATGVTLNKVSGAITLFSAAGSATAASFTVTNSAVAATDTISLSQKSGTDKYNLLVTNVAAGSFQITFFTTGGTTTEQPVFNFNVIKGVAA